MGATDSKQYLPLGGEPILVHTLRVFAGMDEIDELVLVTGVNDMDRCKDLIERYRIRKTVRVVPGGAERQDSVAEGLKALATGTEWVLVHDAVRPLVESDRIRACMNAAKERGAAVLAVPAKDTVKVVGENGRIASTPDRRSLWMVQTPQAFRVSALRSAHERGKREGWTATDDAMLLELAGESVYIVEGDYRNIKITTPDDLEWAEFILGKREGKQS